MGIVVTETWHGQGWSLSKDTITAERFFDVSGVFDPQSAVEAVEVVVNDPYPYQTQLLAQDVAVSDVVGPSYFRVKALYGLPPQGVWPIQDSLEALSLPAEIEWTRGTASFPIDKDISTNKIPIVNSAGDPFDPPYERSVGTWVLTYERWEPIFDGGKAQTYTDCVSSDSFTMAGLTFNPGQTILRSMLPVGKYDTNATKLRMRYVFEMDGSRSDPFQLARLDKGSRGFYSSSGTNKASICDSAGNQISSDVLLDGTGKPADSSLKILNGSTAASPVANPTPIVYWKSAASPPGKTLYFQIKGSQAFATLGLTF